jgi:hypothetical protein
MTHHVANILAPRQSLKVETLQFVFFLVCLLSFVLTTFSQICNDVENDHEMSLSLDDITLSQALDRYEVDAAMDDVPDFIPGGGAINVTRK